MKNSEIINRIEFLNDMEKVKIIRSIKSTKLQFAFDENVKRLSTEFNNVIDKINSFKDPELVKLEAEYFKSRKNKSFNLRDLQDDPFIKKGKEFEQKPEVVELLDFDNDIQLYKLPVDVLPDDLNGEQFVAIKWMITEN